MAHTDTMTSPIPHYAIVIDIEGLIKITCNSINEGEEDRLHDWINHHPDLVYLLNYATELADGQTAQSPGPPPVM